MVGPHPLPANPSWRERGSGCAGRGGTPGSWGRRRGTGVVGQASRLPCPASPQPNWPIRGRRNNRNSVVFLPCAEAERDRGEALGARRSIACAHSPAGRRPRVDYNESPRVLVAFGRGFVKVLILLNGSTR